MLLGYGSTQFSNFGSKDGLKIFKVRTDDYLFKKDDYNPGKWSGKNGDKRLIITPETSNEFYNDGGVDNIL